MMKLVFSFLLLTLCLQSFLPAQTLVSGGIYANTTWTLAGSPYIMTGPVVVFPGKTLTIEPGVEVRVKYDGTPITSSMNYLEIRGNLVAVGTPVSPIVFHTDTLPTEYTWLGIDVKRTQGATISMDYFEISNTVYGIYADLQDAPLWEMHNCLFTYNSYAVQPFGPINFYDCIFRNNGQAIGSGWSVSHAINAKRCEFTDNYSCNGFQYYFSVDSCLIRNNMNGIWNTSGPITNSLFEGNDYAIYAISGTVFRCTFIENKYGLIEFAGNADSCAFFRNGIAAEMNSNGTLINSKFENDTVAVVYASTILPGLTPPVVMDNEICGSVNYYVENKCNQNFAIDKNCFCETDSAIIEGLIFDGYDDFTRGLFNYAIYDSTCTTVLAYVMKVMLTNAEGEVMAEDFSLYPVPAGDQIFLSVPANAAGNDMSAALYDAQGRQMGDSRKMDAPELSWDLTGLPSGVYFVRISGNTNSVLRFVK